MNERLLTTDEVAERLRVHPETVKRHLREGTLEGTKTSRRGGWRISEAALQKYHERFGPDAEPPVILPPDLDQGMRRDLQEAEQWLAALEKQPRTRKVRKLLRMVRTHVKQGHGIVTTLDELKAAGIVAEREEFAEIADKMPKQ